MAEQETCIFDNVWIERAVRRIAFEIIERNKTVEGLAVVGLEPRGVALSRRLAAEINKAENTQVPLGTVDISLYRDDLDERPLQSIIRGTEIDFDVTEMNIVLVDDVLHTGRTIRAALDQLMDLGRPKSIQLAVLIDRGHRELPIAPNYVGKRIDAMGTERVVVRLKETHDTEEVVLIQQ